MGWDPPPSASVFKLGEISPKRRCVSYNNLHLKLLQLLVWSLV